MPFVKAQCTNCGGHLEVDSSKDAAICPFCNSPYIVEKAINQYQIRNKYEIQHANCKRTERTGIPQRTIQLRKTYYAVSEKLTAIE